jgi:hypothetical protein
LCRYDQCDCEMDWVVDADGTRLKGGP